LSLRFYSGVSESKLKLRPYQVEALAAVEKRYRHGTRRQLIALPTGMGKTVVFASLSRHLGIKGKTLVLVHREELADQAADKLRRWNPGIRIGIEMAGRASAASDDVVVASVSTIGRAGSPRLSKFPSDEIDLIIVDEAHHSVANTYKTIFDHFGVRDERNRKLLVGVTATPNRGDSQGLGQVYDEIVYEMSILNAIKQGWLTDIRGMRVRTEASLDDVSTRDGDFVVGELSHTVNTYIRNKLVVDSWRELGEDRQTVVFCVDVAHAQSLAKMFQESGVGADAVWGNDANRAKKLAAFRAGSLRVLTNCAVLTEGWDCWQVACIVMARPTKSELLFVQVLGRGPRIPEDIDNLHDARRQAVKIPKSDCLVIDVTDNTRRHRLMTLNTLFGLGEKLNLKGTRISEAIEQIARVQRENAFIDFRDLDSLDNLKTYVEQVSLLEQSKWSPEVIENSKMRWHKVFDGRYSLLLPNNEGVTVYRDLLDKWNVRGMVATNSFEKKGIISLPEAFRCADEIIATFSEELLHFMRRSWPKNAATPAQRRAMNIRGIKYEDEMTKNEATKAIEAWDQALFNVRVRDSS
jgi:ATP-dependent helicase IRC3